MFSSNPVPPGFIVMNHWNIVILEFDNGEVLEKFLGLDTSTGRHRISSHVLEYDAERDTGKTLSGSRYRFIDKPGKLHPDAQQVYEKIESQFNAKASLKFPRAFDA
jgi:hypothetical protein